MFACREYRKPSGETNPLMARSYVVYYYKAIERLQECTQNRRKQNFAFLEIMIKLEGTGF